MQYSFWNSYKFLPYQIAIQLDIRLQNIFRKVERFFQQTISNNSIHGNIQFILAGSCLKLDSFRDVDLFFLNKNDVQSISTNIDSKYFLYENNSSSYMFDNDIFQIVYRERFENKNLNEIVDYFDFSSTKIAFLCQIDFQSFKIKVLESDIRKEFIHYMKTTDNYLSKVNSNPFVSLQRALYFKSKGDNVPFNVFLKILDALMDLDYKIDIEKYFQKLQGNKEELYQIKKDIQYFINIRKNKDV